MIVCRVSRCIDHRHLWVRSSERFRDIPACQGVGQSDIGNQKIDFLGFMERLQRTDARGRLQYRPSSCRRSVTISSRIIQSSSTTRTVTTLRAATTRALQPSPRVADSAETREGARAFRSKCTKSYTGRFGGKSLARSRPAKFGQAENDRMTNIPRGASRPACSRSDTSKFARSNYASESVHRVHHRLRPYAAGVGG